MKKHNVNVGNEYRRTLGCVKQNVKVVGFDAEADKFKPFIIETKGGKRFTADEKTIKKWELLKAVEVETELNTKKAVKTVEHRKNAITCLEAAIQTLIRRNVPMNAKELVTAMKEDGAFVFKDTAKTPWNSVGTRLATYMNNCEGECRIKCVSRGKYAHADYEPVEA